jgi:hypothetical protein
MRGLTEAYQIQRGGKQIHVQTSDIPYRKILVIKLSTLCQSLRLVIEHAKMPWVFT